MPTQVQDSKTRALIEELYHIPENGKAEIIHGKIVRMSPTGAKPGRVAFRIASSLSQHEERLRLAGENAGYAFCDNVGFLVDLPGRSSFSPDAAWYTGSGDAEEMEFLPDAPVFAAEVRSKNDYGPQAEREIADKIRDYFSAGAEVIWDVDTLGRDVVKVYRSANPETPTVYRRGDIAEAEPAVPGWKMPVDDLFARPVSQQHA